MTDAPSPPDKDARMWATICHIAGLVGPLGPLIVWLIKKEEYPIVKEQGREALNFEITVLLACLAAMALTLVMTLLPPLLCVVWLLFPAILVANIVFIILAALQANKGVAYRYPVCLRLIK